MKMKIIKHRRRKIWTKKIQTLRKCIIYICARRIPFQNLLHSHCLRAPVREEYLSKIFFIAIVWERLNQFCECRIGVSAESKWVENRNGWRENEPDGVIFTYKDGLHGLHLLGLGLWKMTNGTKRSQDITYLSVFHPKTIVFWLLGKNYKDFK